ncbi:MAG: GNAT family N-acetyltransferase [Flavobacteriaceae bacterium]
MEHFEIKPLHIKDAKSLSALMLSNNERYSRFFPKTLEQNLSEAASKEYILRKDKEIRAKTAFTYAIKEKTKVVGRLIIKNIDQNKKVAELAYCIDSKHESKGWMTKAIREITNYAFSDLGLEKLQVIVHRSNIGSIKVAENNTYLWIKTLEKGYTPPNEEALDMELYELKSQT